MNRRTLLKTAPAALLTTVVPLSVLGQTEGGSNGFQAVYFDGKTYLTNPGTDESLRLPASATTGLIPYNYKSNSPPPPYTYGLICGVLGTGGGNLSLFHTTFQDPETQYLQLTITNPQNALGLSAWTQIPYDDNWHQTIVGFNTEQQLVTVVLDGRNLPMTYNKGNNNQGKILFNAPIFIGGQGGPPGVGWYKGDLTDIFGYFGPNPDATNPKVIAGFFDVRNQLATRNSPDGQTAIPGTPPNIFLSGNPNKFPKNGPSSIRHFSWTSDDPQSPFTIGAGTLQPAGSDPWNYPVVGTSAAAHPSRVIRARQRLGTPIR